jgi:poly(3-hydroxybutyrate) depolymerase
MGNHHTLPSMSANANYTTISGFSGGSYMADQLHVIYSETFKGGAYHAGGPIGVIDYQQTDMTNSTEIA